MADRIQRIQSIIGKNISEIIQFEVKNPRIGFCTVSEVEVSKDFSYAKIYVSFLGAKYPSQNLEELNNCKGYIRSSLSKKIDIRKTPELTFLLDETFKKSEKLDEVLRRDQEIIDQMKKKQLFKILTKPVSTGFFIASFKANIFIGFINNVNCDWICLSKKGIFNKA